LSHFVCVCVGEIIPLPWFSKELKTTYWRTTGFMASSLCISFVNQYSLSGGFPFPIVLMPKYNLSLCHTPIKPDLLGFSWIGVFAWPHDHEFRIIWYQSLAPLTRLYPSEIFVSSWFRKNSLVSNFFFSLNLQHIKN